MILQILTILMRALFFPLFLFFRFIEEISGQGRRYRRQRRLMVDERPPLNDEEYLQALGASEPDAPLWLAVRKVMAELAGVPKEAIRPEDRLDDLGRMQWMGPDELDIIFRLERALGMKIPRPKLAEEFGGNWPKEFGPFADGVVRALKAIRETPGS